MLPTIRFDPVPASSGTGDSSLRRTVSSRLIGLRGMGIVVAQMKGLNVERARSNNALEADESRLVALRAPIRRRSMSR